MAVDVPAIAQLSCSRRQEAGARSCSKQTKAKLYCSQFCSSACLNFEAGAGDAGAGSTGSSASSCTKLRCPAAGKGKKRGRFDIAEYFERVAKGRRTAKGKRRKFMCFSEYVDFHKSRPEPFRLTDVQAAEKWKRDLQNPAVIKDRVRGPDANGLEGKGPWVRALCCK